MESDENIYRINLQKSLTASALVYDLSSYLEMDETKNKKILLEMSDIDLNVAQLKSIRSLINSINSSLAFISTNSQITKESAMALEIVITDENTKPEPVEPEKTYKTIDELIIQNGEAKDESELDEPDVIVNSEKDVSGVEQDELEELFDSVQNVDNGEKEENIEDSISKPDLIDPLDKIFETEKSLERLLKLGDNDDESTEVSGKDIEYYKNLDNEFTEDDLEIDNLSTMYVKHTLRSGQVINYDGNVVIIGDCHTGSEVHATGDITVWGVLSGIAHAGSNGNIKAKIRALKMNAIQLRIADGYARKPDVLNTVLLAKTNEFIPEEARFIDGDIVIFKIND